MGEAKRRKQIDPDYGRVPKDDFRGLVVCPPLWIKADTLIVKSTNLDPQELRFALLFWDQLVWPSSRAFYIQSGPDEQFLESAKVLIRPDYTFDGNVATSIAQTQIHAYQRLNHLQPGKWAMAQGVNSFQWVDGSADDGTGTSIELHRAIPIPRHDVPLAEILEFRQRRRPELLLLRHHLESLAAEITAASDQADKRDRVLAEIDEACANLLALGREWQFPVYLSNIKATFNLSPVKLIPAAGAVWAVAQPYGLMAAGAAAAVAGAASTLEIKADWGLRSAKRSPSPYRYAFEIDRELK